MRILKATTQTNGAFEGDYAYCIPGELVMMFPSCANPKCGCDRGFGGLSSHRATTTAIVEESEMTEGDVRAALATSLRDGGWVVGGGPAAGELVDEAWADLTAVTNHFAVGTVVGRRDWTFYARGARPLVG